MRASKALAAMQPWNSFEVRKGQVERIFREAVFPHRAKFPELKSTYVVAQWEKATQLKW
jgi:hypothetical protein